MRVGLFGGTFNPIHHGHLRAAVEIQESFQLQKLYLIPAALPPHKDLKYVISATDRIEMTRLAIQDYPDFVLSDVELKRSGPSYTVDTVQQFQHHLEPGSDLFLIMGLDAFLEIDTWKSYRQLVKMLPIIVMARPLKKNSATHTEWSTMTQLIHSQISDGYQYSDEKQCYLHERYKAIYRHSISMLDISATKIRQLVRQKRSIRFLVPQSVETYILNQGIYT